jgi:hypothetical protein
MSKKLDLSDLDSIEDQLFKFIWTFKVGDNILYNFELLQVLYNAKLDSNNSVFNKPITITIVSIIEAILIDFIRRIGEATDHKPPNIPKDELKKMKSKIIKDRVKVGAIYKRKKYYFREIINLFQEYEIFGEKDDDFYNLLSEYGFMRNRVHIENYYENHEKDEENVFTNERLERLETILYQLWNKMISDYPRPWPSS